LDVDNGFGLEQALAQLRVLPLQFHHPLPVDIRHRRRTTTLARRQPGQGTGLALAPPNGQVGGIQPLPTQQRAELARFAALGLLQHPQLVLGRKAAPMGLLDDFRVRCGRYGGGHRHGARTGGGNSGRPTGSLRFLPLCINQNLFQLRCHR
jgi:hypothetical protein